MDCIGENCSVRNEFQILQTAYSDYGDSEPPKKKLKRFNV